MHSNFFVHLGNELNWDDPQWLMRANYVAKSSKKNTHHEALLIGLPSGNQTWLILVWTGWTAYLVQFPAARYVWWHILCQGGKELHCVCRTSSACYWGTDPWSQLCEFSTRTKKHLSVRKLLGCGLSFFLTNINEYEYLYIWCHDVAVLSQIDRRFVTGFSHVWLVWSLTSFSSPKNVSSTVNIILWHCLYIYIYLFWAFCSTKNHLANLPFIILHLILWIEWNWNCYWDWFTIHSFTIHS